jgi:adenylate cyclase
LAKERVERKLVAILALEVLGCSCLVGDDEHGTFTRLKLHRRELAALEIGEHHGRIVRMTGESLLV